MQILLAFLLMIIGFVLLVKASDIFVDAVSSIATNFKMSKMMIALTVAAFGTCAPELAISFNSISSGVGDIALANVLGSNVVNILLVIGLAAFVTPIRVKNDVVKKELPILLSTTSLFAIAIAVHYLGPSIDHFILNRYDGILFMLLFVLFIAYIISTVRAKRGILERGKPKYKLWQSIFLTIICCVVIVIASDMVVDNAKLLASYLNVSTKLITMTFVVIGTSLPEMTMTVMAAKKGEFDIALGNIIGTNIFNIGVVLGLPLMIYGGFTSAHFNLIDILAVHIAAIVLYLFARNDKVLSRAEGLVMLLIFSAYYAYILFA